MQSRPPGYPSSYPAAAADGNRGLRVQKQQVDALFAYARQTVAHSCNLRDEMRVNMSTAEELRIEREHFRVTRSDSRLARRARRALAA